MQDPITLIAGLGVVPVIAIERVSDAVPLAEALLEGGLPVAEITFRTEAAADVAAQRVEKGGDIRAEAAVEHLHHFLELRDG